MNLQTDNYEDSSKYGIAQLAKESIFSRNQIFLLLRINVVNSRTTKFKEKMYGILL